MGETALGDKPTEHIADSFASPLVSRIVTVTNLIEVPFMAKPKSHPIGSFVHAILLPIRMLNEPSPYYQSPYYQWYQPTMTQPVSYQQPQVVTAPPNNYQYNGGMQHK